MFASLWALFSLVYWNRKQRRRSSLLVHTNAYSLPYTRMNRTQKQTQRRRTADRSERRALRTFANCYASCVRLASITAVITAAVSRATASSRESITCLHTYRRVLFSLVCTAWRSGELYSFYQLYPVRNTRLAVSVRSVST